MRADFDSRADTIQIELEPADRLDRDDASVDGTVVGFLAERPVLIDIIGSGTSIERRLEAVAERHGLDAEGLIAAARAALAAPDRTVTMDVALVRTP
jgi:hypothetical protein